MRLSYAITFEFTENAPETVRGESSVANVRLGARRAVEAAQKACPNRKWASISILLERLDEEREAGSREARSHGRAECTV